MAKKKITLSRETLRLLDSVTQRIVGGVTSYTQCGCATGGCDTEGQQTCDQQKSCEVCQSDQCPTGAIQCNTDGACSAEC